MEKRCGNCRWWRETRVLSFPSGDSLVVGECKCPVPAAIAEPKKRYTMEATDGESCPCHEPKEEDRDGKQIVV